MADENQISGSQILREVRVALQRYRAAIEQLHRKVAVVRFEAGPDDPADWQYRMLASQVSANQKIKAFSALGLAPEHVVLPSTVSDAQFADLIERFSTDEAVVGIIVQFPPSAALRQFVQGIAPAKDIDALLGARSPFSACATADGISWVIEPFARDHPQIAVVGAKGFVGRGVVSQLQGQGHTLMQLDLGDDLRASGTPTSSRPSPAPDASSAPSISPPTTGSSWTPASCRSRTAASRAMCSARHTPFPNI
jgi:methylenetetrahydrofolate dehydrogenase (NADP+)/methenyltetrahydrofolate cyclohydrolase